MWAVTFINLPYNNMENNFQFTVKTVSNLVFMIFIFNFSMEIQYMYTTIQLHIVLHLEPVHVPHTSST